jgi:glutamate carboxypeptidase
MVTPRELLSALRDRTPRMLDEIERLVNIDSGSYYAEGVTQVARLVGSRLEELGFTATLEDVPERGARMSAVRRFGGRGRLMILGHADTVWPAGTVAEWPFAIAGDRATGPGVGDMKGGLVMALHALELLIERDAARFETVRYVLVPDEELGSPRSRAWIEENARQSDWVLVLEPTRPGGGLVTSRGAVGAFFVDADGVSAHAAVNYAKGASAIRELAAMVGRLELLSRPDEGIIVNVGVFNGGAARQVIPHHARIHVDLRARTPDQVAYLDRELSTILSGRQNPRVSVRLSGEWTRPVFPRGEGTVSLFETARGIAEKLGIEAFEVPPTNGGSDGSFCAALGVPTLDGMGPLCFDTCSREETIPVSSVAERGAIFAGVIAQLCRRLEI